MLPPQNKPTEHRQGTLIQLVDLLQTIIELSRSDSMLKPTKDKDYMDIEYDPEAVDKLTTAIKKLHSFDITETGDLYLTSGGRIVLDRGYGEVFNETDTKLFTLKELHAGIHFKHFIWRINKDINELFIEANKDKLPEKLLNDLKAWRTIQKL